MAMSRDSIDSGKATVLVVDDEEQVCRLLYDELSASGFDCHVTASALEAKRLLERQPDVMVSFSASLTVGSH